LDILISRNRDTVKIADRPYDCVAEGTGKVLENIDALKDMLMGGGRRR
jgi:rod shape-determining protein MreB